MVRKDDMGTVRDAKAVRWYSFFMEISQLFDQWFRVDHHAVSDDRDLFREEDTRRNQVQLELFAVDYDGVSGIVPTLIASNDFCIGW